MDSFKDDKIKKNNILDDEKPLEDHQNGEFVDDLESEDDYLLDDDLDNNFSAETDYSNRPQKKTSVNMFNVVVFGGLALAVIGAGAVFIPKMFTSETPEITQATAPQQTSTMAVQQDTQINKDIAEAAVTSSLPSEVSQSGGLLANPDSLVDETQTQDMSSQSQTNSNESFEALEAPEFRDQQNSVSANYANEMYALFNDPAINNTDETTEVTDIEGTVVTTNDIPPLPLAADADVSTMSTENDNNPITYEQLGMPSASEEAINNSAPTAISAASGNSEIALRLNDLAANMETLAAEMGAMVNAMNSKIDNLESRVSQPTNNSDISALQKSIEKLEDRVESLNKSRGSTSSNSSTKPVVQMAPETSDTQPRSRNNAADAAYTPSSNEASRSNSPQPATNWTLRGASTGEAYLADKNSGTVRTVKIGDTVNGLGRVQSIAVENGKWMVRGTTGTVSQ